MEVTQENQQKIFICYSRRDETFALRLARDLRDAGIGIWMDQLDIPAGAVWDKEVESALRVTRTTLVILSPAAVASENVRDEIGAAVDARDRIIPVLHQKCDVPLRLSRYQYVDFTGDYPMSFDRLVRQIQGKQSEPVIETSIRPGSGWRGIHMQRGTVWKGVALLSVVAIAIGVFAVVTGRDDREIRLVQEIAVDHNESVENLPICPCLNPVVSTRLNVPCTAGEEGEEADKLFLKAEIKHKEAFRAAQAKESDRAEKLRTATTQLAKQAIGKYQCALDRDPDNARIHGNIGAAYYLAGNLGRASSEIDAYFELSKKRNPNPPDGWYIRARVRCAQGDIEGARDAAVKAVAFTPEKRVDARSAREAFLNLMNDNCFKK